MAFLDNFTVEAEKDFRIASNLMEREIPRTFRQPLAQVWLRFVNRAATIVTLKRTRKKVISAAIVLSKIPHHQFPSAGSIFQRSVIQLTPKQINVEEKEGRRGEERKLSLGKLSLREGRWPVCVVMSPLISPSSFDDSRLENDLFSH